VLALFLRGPLWESGQGALQYLHHEGFYANLFPHWLLIGFYAFFWGLSMLGALVGAARFWQAMKAADRSDGRETTSVVSSWLRTFKSILTHDRFGKCASQVTRRTAHLGAFYGFLALFLVSIWAVVALYMINPMIPGHDQDLVYPFAILNPWKLLANLGGGSPWLSAACWLFENAGVDGRRPPPAPPSIGSSSGCCWSLGRRAC
jgi:hypothetical protein